MNIAELRRLMALRSRQQAMQQPTQQESFRSFGASELFCPKCNKAMPVREKRLLYLPGGELFDYTCPQCGTSLGTKKTG